MTMKHAHYLALTITVALFQVGAAFAQYRPTVSLGGGFLATQGMHHHGSNLLNTAGMTLGLSMPVWKRPLFSLGIGLAGDYGSAKGSPGAPVQPFAVAGGTTLPTGAGVPETAQRLLRIGAGPEIDVRLGNHLMITPKLHAGFAQAQRDGFSVVQRVEYGKETYDKEIYGQDRVASGGLFYAPKLRLSAPLGKRFSVWGEASYAFQRVEVTRRTLQFAGQPDENGAYAFGTWIEGRPLRERTSIMWKTLGGQVGLSMALGKPKQPKREGPAPGRSTTAVRGNVNREQPEDQQQARKLVTAHPIDNARYTGAEEIETLQWKLVGAPIPTPAYVVELMQLDSDRKPMRTHIGKSATSSIRIDAFPGADLADGHYRWRVTEVSSGLVSDTRAFSISNCAIDLSIENDTVACLGYEGSDRKYRICFDALYASPSGDLSYNDPGSGLFVYDQQYTPINYTLVGQHSSLVNQPGASSSTIHYCVEVSVPSGVTAIGLALQGDDLDPSPVLCQPGVSLVLDSLPECLCDDCETLDVSFGDFDITAQNSQGTQYLFDGHITVNQPVYGVEVQVISYQYTANPGGCTTGVNNVETSGMIFVPASTIAGTDDLQASHPVTKIVRYLSATPLTGSIPLQLAIGLPGTLPGFDADCCAIDYEVCLKVNVLYEDGSCKACPFTHCFQFDNH